MAVEGIKRYSCMQRSSQRHLCLVHLKPCSVQAMHRACLLILDAQKCERPRHCICKVHRARQAQPAISSKQKYLLTIIHTHSQPMNCERTSSICKRPLKPGVLCSLGGSCR